MLELDIMSTISVERGVYIIFNDFINWPNPLVSRLNEIYVL